MQQQIPTTPAQWTEGEAQKWIGSILDYAGVDVARQVKIGRTLWLELTSDDHGERGSYNLIRQWVGSQNPADEFLALYGEKL